MTQPAPTRDQVENALHQWVRQATGLPAAKVIWKNQNGPRPARPYVTLRVFESQDIGLPHTNRTDNPTPTPGNEITYRVRGQERVRVNFEAVTDFPTGENSAPALLKRIRGVLRLPSIRTLLNAVPIGVSSWGPITSLDFLENKTQQLSRATVDCVAYLPTEYTEGGTYIETEDHEVNLTP